MVMVVIIGYCNDGWTVVWTVVSVADVIRKIFFIRKFCGGMGAIGGGVNVGCGGSSLAHQHHHQQQQQHHHHLHHILNHHLHHHFNHTAYT